MSLPIDSGYFQLSAASLWDADFLGFGYRVPDYVAFRMSCMPSTTDILWICVRFSNNYGTISSFHRLHSYNEYPVGIAMANALLS
jgi:hypothetical protein